MSILSQTLGKIGSVRIVGTMQSKLKLGPHPPTPPSNIRHTLPPRPPHPRVAPVHPTHALQMMDNVVKHRAVWWKAQFLGKAKDAADYLQNLNPDEDEEKMESASWGKAKY